MSEDAHALDFEKLTSTGFWFCTACQKISESIDPDGPYQCPKCGMCRLKWCPPVPRQEAPELARQESIWRRSAARDRYRMRQCALWWRDDGSRGMLDAAIASRNNYQAATARAAHYAQLRKERAA